VENPKTFRIDRGIGQYDFNDYYAVLGLPLTADAAHVRKRYILIAKCLHPDIHGRTSVDKQVATEYLSKLVNPAYNVLSQERERTEYSAILKLLGKRLMKRNQKFMPQSEIAKQYLTSSQEINYEKTINEIAKIQYQDLNCILDNIALLSEINLVHILLNEGYKHTSGISVPNASSHTNSGVSVDNSNPSKVNNNTDASNNKSGYQMRSEPQTPLHNNNSYNSTQNTNKDNTNQDNKVTGGSINQYIKQAEIYINQKLWASALKELRSAIQIDCNNSKCHALLGFVYMNQKLSGMAKVSFQQALKLNPDEPIAKQYIDQVSGTSSAGGTKNQPKSKDDKKGGFFGWLGGG
jgi:curved DNA-binding protein CbpA